MGAASERARLLRNATRCQGRILLDGHDLREYDLEQLRANIGVIFQDFARSEFEVFQRFKELSEGKTAVLISHRFSSVRMADRILVLVEGTVEAGGTHEELLAERGRYAELFELQAAGYR